MKLISALTLAALIAFLGGCDPKKPSEPKQPVPKVDFNHERSTL